MKINTTIILNGEIADRNALLQAINQSDHVIAVDGGIRHLRELNRCPEFFIGDQDSIAEKDLKYLKDNLIPVQKFPVKKDFTDSELALQKVLAGVHNVENKPVIALFAAFGNRYDHLLSNQFLACRNSDHADFILSDGLRWQFIFRAERDEMREIQLKDLPIPEFQYQIKSVFSILSMSEQVGRLTIENTEYKLTDYTLKYGESRGISNVAKNDLHPCAGLIKIRFSDGRLALFINPAE